MTNIKTKCIIGLVILLTIGGVASASLPVAQAKGDNRTPELPSPLCDNIQAPVGNKLAFHAYAIGVQVYRWNGMSWDFVAPIARLFADANYRGEVGSHYAGPTWESNSGSKVVARRLTPGCSPDATAIPWLLLETVLNDGHGIFSSVTYVQRLNTTGGLAPSSPGASIGAEASVPYTAEYYFYRADN